MNDKGKIIGALLLGIVTGATIGALFAPEKGDTARAILAEAAKDVSNDLKQRIKAEADKLRKKADELETIS